MTEQDRATVLPKWTGWPSVRFSAAFVRCL